MKHSSLLEMFDREKKKANNNSFDISCPIFPPVTADEICVTQMVSFSDLFIVCFLVISIWIANPLQSMGASHHHIQQQNENLHIRNTATRQAAVAYS